jgi:flagellar basal body-associated protein FliL
MSENFEKLKAFGAQKIYEDTHITRANAEALLEKSFNQFDKIRFYGFISILEREYGFDLQELRDEFDEYCKEYVSEEESELKEVVYEFQTRKKRKIMGIVALIILIAALGLFFYFFLQHAKQHPAKPLPINNIQINKATQLIQDNATKDTDENATSIVDANRSAENNTTTENNVSKAVVSQSAIKAKKLKFLTNTKLWLGITDMDTWKQTQKTIHHFVDINVSKNYFFVLGHGMVTVDLGDKNVTFPQRGKVWLEYKNGTLQELTQQQYMQASQGKAW